MLGNGMAESKSAEIALPSISSSALLSTMEFLYAGNFRRYQPTTGVAILELMHAGQYFLIPKLERRAFNLAVPFFEDLKARKREEQEEVTLRLFCVALTNSDMSNLTTQNILNRIVRAMGCSEISLTALAQLTMEQMEMYVNVARRRWGRGKGFRSQVGFYHRVRLILLWCAGCVSNEAAESLDANLPYSEVTLEDLSRTEISRANPKPCAPLDWDPVQRKESVRMWVTRCQGMLQLWKVPTQLLSRAIEPLDVVPPAMLFEAYRRKALRPEVSVLKWDSGMHGPQYKVRGRGSVLEAIKYDYTKGDNYNGFAITGMGILDDRGDGEWEFVVEEWIEGNLELGFCAGSQLDGEARYENGNLKDEGWALTREGLVTYFREEWPAYAGTAHVKKNARVRVRIVEHKCSFIINGVDYGVAWENIPSQVYPACTVRHPGRVRIQNVVN